MCHGHKTHLRMSEPPVAIGYMLRILNAIFMIIYSAQKILFNNNILLNTIRALAKRNNKLFIYL